uniref:Uncharacterized protein n=1 Tax=Glossina pallidipes TaxID=7398 RepID=A0A1B0A2Q7_GLOPL
MSTGTTTNEKTREQQRETRHERRERRREQPINVATETYWRRRQTRALLPGALSHVQGLSRTSNSSAGEKAAYPYANPRLIRQRQVPPITGNHTESPMPFCTQEMAQDKSKIECIASPFPSMYGLAEKVDVENSVADSVPMPSDELTFGSRKTTTPRFLLSVFRVNFARAVTLALVTPFCSNA